MRRWDFRVDQLRRAPAHYRFFAVEESVYFGDEEQIRRVNADPRLIDGPELRQWSLSGGDFADKRTAAWVADQLNKARGYTESGISDPLVTHELAHLIAGINRAIRGLEKAR